MLGGCANAKRLGQLPCSVRLRSCTRMCMCRLDGGMSRLVSTITIPSEIKKKNQSPIGARKVTLTPRIDASRLHPQRGVLHKDSSVEWQALEERQIRHRESTAYYVLGVLGRFAAQGTPRSCSEPPSCVLMHS